MRILGHVRWPRPVLLLLASAVIAGWYLYLVPRGQWIGLLPSTASRSAPPEQIAVVSPRLQAVLDGLQANLTAVYDKYNATVPPAVYPTQALTDAQLERYRHLQTPSLTRSARIQANALGRTPLPKYMFTTLTRNIGESLPDLLVALATVIDFVGPEHTSFSILEGPSDDLTPVILEEVLRPLLLHLHVADSAVNIVTNAPKVHWDEVNRIEELAKLRNQALEPLWADSSKQYLASTPEHKRRTVGTDVAAVVFFNDVFIQASDFLELLHQHVVNSQGNPGVGITTAWDWMAREPAHFYDVWVARTIDSGDLFYPIRGEWWTPSEDILESSAKSRAAFETLTPFQAFSSWNAMAVLSPTPFLPPFSVRFRRSKAEIDECAASECTLIASDFWKFGWGRVEVVPSVQLAYSHKVAVDTALALKRRKTILGWHDGVPPSNYDGRIRWIKEAPPKVRCHPWPEQNGLEANVWKTTRWVAPYLL